MNRLRIDADRRQAVINRNIYGHFAEHLGRCVYEGLWVGEESEIPNTRGIRDDVVEALKRIRVPVLRWPGGCFADEYHWRDGVGPPGERPEMVNTHWGGVTENNHFGTHEFMELCERLDCAPYICGNVGSGTVREMQQWVEYLTFEGRSPMADLRRANGREAPWRLPYFGVGNENWGCGGHMRPEYYADQYRRYQTYVRNLSGNEVFKIACGPNGADYAWTETLMRSAAGRMDGLALHYYCGTGEKSRSATEFDERDWFVLLRKARRMDELISRHATIMDRHDPDKRVALIVDEWGTWHATEPNTNPRFLYQQNTLRDALVAGVTLNIFNHHCDRVRMANIAQTVNVLQAMVLTDGPKMLTTPSYHVFEMYAGHQDATLCPTHLECEEYTSEKESIPSLSASVSRSAEQRILATLCNLHHEKEHELECVVRGASVERVSARVLTADTMSAHNTFEQHDRISPLPLRDIQKHPGGFTVLLPGRSVVAIELLCS